MSGGRMEFSMAFGQSPERGRAAEDEPFRILVLSDLSGRQNRGVCDPIAGRAARTVDIDNVEQVLAKLAPRLELPPATGAEQTLTVAFEELDDFHPDALYKRLALIAALRDLRQRLGDPAIFPQAAAELKASPPEAPPEASSQRQPAGGEFERLLGGEVAAADEADTRPQAQRSGLEDMIRRVVGPHIVSGPDPQQRQLISSVDDATSGLMRTVLHQRDFQALEAAWRGVHFLITSLELDETLQVAVLDVSSAELEADLCAPGSDGAVQQSGLWKLLVEQTVATPGGKRWGLLVGDYLFDRSATDVALLGQLAQVAAGAGAPLVAGAAPGVVGYDSFATAPDAGAWHADADTEAAQRWARLRGHPQADHLGLAAPRFLLRLPYGAKTEPIDSFGFEEVVRPLEDHDRYLWANSAWAIARLFGEAFTERRWYMEGGERVQVDGLPVHSYVEDDESRMKPCAEAFLSARSGEVMLGSGLTPVLSFKGRDAVRVMRIQSIADPPKALCGRWA